ncbi:hypothetical protein D3C78_1458770 [compost metagenome]
MDLDPGFDRWRHYRCSRGFCPRLRRFFQQSCSAFVHRTDSWHPDHGAGHVHLLCPADDDTGAHRPVQRSGRDHHAQLRRLYRRNYSRRCVVDPPRVSRGRAGTGAVKKRHLALRHRPPGISADDPGTGQPMDRQHQGHLALYCHRCRRTDPPGSGSHCR